MTLMLTHSSFPFQLAYPNLIPHLRPSSYYYFLERPPWRNLTFLVHYDNPCLGPSLNSNHGLCLIRSVLSLSFWNLLLFKLFPPSLASLGKLCISWNRVCEPEPLVCTGAVTRSSHSGGVAGNVADLWTVSVSREQGAACRACAFRCHMCCST